MIVWCIVVGAVIGWAMAGFVEYGAILGGIAGVGAGFWMRAEVRREIAATLERLGAASEAAEAPPAPASRIHEPPATATPPPAVPSEAAVEAPEAAPPPAIEVQHERRTVEPPAPAEPAPPREPDVVQQALAMAREWLLGGNTIVRVGLVILFIGLTFLARYAASIGLFPLELRLSLVGLAGLALLAVGFVKREQRPAFARALQGTGVAVLYLTVFTSSRLFELIPILPAFGFMIAFCALGCALALLQSSQAMALASFAGGFAVPVILGGHAETPLVPFSYYTMLNLAILFIAWRRSWRMLNLLGFAATFGMAIVWGMTSYEPRFYTMTQVFLAISVLTYIATAVLYAHNTPGRLGNVTDSTLLFGPAIAGFGLQAGMMRPYEYGSAFSALAFGATYIGFAALTLRQRREEMRLMVEGLIAIGVGFVTLAIPLALDAKWTSSAWALEGLGAFWVGMRQARWLPRLFGLLLQALAALVLLNALEPNVSAIPLANAGFVGAVLIAAPALLTAWWLRKPLEHSGSQLAKAYARVERAIVYPAFLAGFAFACIALVLEATRAVPAEIAGALPVSVFRPSTQRLLSMVGILAAMWGAAMFARRKDWPLAAWPGRASLPLLGFVLLVQVVIGRHVLDFPDWLLWLAGFALHAHMLYLDDTSPAGETRGALRSWLLVAHAGTAWFVTLAIADCLQLGVDRAHLWDTSWAGVIFLVAATGVLAALTRWAGPALTGQHRPWPLRLRARSYGWIAAAPLAAATFFGALITAMFAQGVTDPLPYVPLLNPVDLSVALALAVLALWRRMLARLDPQPGGAALVTGHEAVAAAAVLAFVLANSIWLRTAYHWLGVDWSVAGLLDDFVVQTGLAILWTVLAMVLMLQAHRSGVRVVWLTGAGLLVMVVIKLVLVDLSNAGGWERMVAFISVGVLMLVIGYFAPLPPRQAVPESAGDPA